MDGEMGVLCIAKRCSEALARQGIEYRAATMVLFGMVAEDVTYWESLRCFADYERVHEGISFAPERWHSEICYRLIKAWIIEPPAQWFEVMAGEVRAIADGISA